MNPEIKLELQPQRLIVQYKNKIKTFYGEIDVNHFIGAYNNDALYSTVTAELFYKIYNKRLRGLIPPEWDNGESFTASEWQNVTNEILLKFRS